MRKTQKKCIDIFKKYEINDSSNNIEKAKKPVQVRSKTGKIFTQMREEGKQEIESAKGHNHSIKYKIKKKQ